MGTTRYSVNAVESCEWEGKPLIDQKTNQTIGKIESVEWETDGSLVGECRLFCET